VNYGSPQIVFLAKPGRRGEEDEREREANASRIHKISEINPPSLGQAARLYSAQPIDFDRLLFLDLFFILYLLLRRRRLFSSP
jgi:hypothetical protein